METPEGWNRLRKNNIQCSDVINASDLMKEMAEALEESEKFVGNGDRSLKATKAFLALKHFKEWK